MLINLRTKRLVLRPLNTDDLITVHKYASDIDNTRYMIYLPNETIDDTMQFLVRVNEEWQKNSPMFYEFAVVLNDMQIGAVSLYLNNDKTEGELGWILNKNYWGNGYATEAALAVKNYAIDQLDIKKLVAHCDFRNKSSSRVMEKIGLALESDNGVRQYRNTTEKVRELIYSTMIV